MQKLTLIVAVMIMVGAGSWLWLSAKAKQQQLELIVSPAPTAANQSAAPVATSNPMMNNQVESESNSQPIASPLSQDTSYATLEKELNSTVILDEDFSDL